MMPGAVPKGLQELFRGRWNVPRIMVQVNRSLLKEKRKMVPMQVMPALSRVRRDRKFFQ